MNISNTDFSFATRDSRSAYIARKILAKWRMWTLNTVQEYSQRQRTIHPLAIVDHLLRDIGITRLGVSEATLAGQNEADTPIFRP